jgi:hypothetical protein
MAPIRTVAGAFIDKEIVVSEVPGNPRARRRRGRRALLLLLAITVVGGGLTALSATADAAQPMCEDGSPPPCNGEDPPGPTIPPPPPTNPPTPNWHGRVTVLDQSPKDQSFVRDVFGSWARSIPSPTPSARVQWTDPAKLEGTVDLAETSWPAGSLLGFRLQELGSNGRMCRGNPLGAIPPTGRTARVLVAPPVTKTKDDLALMAAGSVGTTSPAEDVELTISSANLVPHAGGLRFEVAGRIYANPWWAPAVDASFTYSTALFLNPSTNVTDLNEVVTVWASPGELDFPDTNLAADILLWLADDVEPAFRGKVVEEIATKINSQINTQADVMWFKTLGYSVSMRSVTTSDDDLVFHPSLCKVD